LRVIWAEKAFVSIVAAGTVMSLARSMGVERIGVSCIRNGIRREAQRERNKLIFGPHGQSERLRANGDGRYRLAARHRWRILRAHRQLRAE